MEKNVKKKNIRYYIFVGEDIKFDKKLAEAGLYTDNLHMTKLKWYSKLGKELRKKMIDEYRKSKVKKGAD